MFTAGEIVLIIATSLLIGGLIWVQLIYFRSAAQQPPESALREGDVEGDAAKSGQADPSSDREG